MLRLIKGDLCQDEIKIMLHFFVAQLKRLNFTFVIAFMTDFSSERLQEGFRGKCISSRKPESCSDTKIQVVKIIILGFFFAAVKL